MQKDKDTRTAGMESLPTELLIAIIDHLVHDQFALSQCNRINRQWHNLTQSSLYREPSLIKLSALKLFIRSLETSRSETYLHPHSLDPTNTSTSTVSTSKAATTAGDHVRSINLSMLPHRWEYVQYEIVHAIAVGCPWLEHLDLSNCSLLRDNAVQDLAENLGPRRLRSLVLSGCLRITDLAVLSLCAHAIHLENLELSGCDRLSDISLFELGSRPQPQPLPTSATSESSPSSPSSSSESRKPIENREELDGNPKPVSRPLKRLDLSHCTRITDSGIQGLRAGLHLNSLNLEGCYGILMGDEGLVVSDWEDLDDDEQFTDIDDD
ncbi:hypothetical protein BGZ83_006047 [Gryganskiella cystojenkinii]|nr:hypothetical protein BGZ83_006047 [Gryganskiella cystojenkinii]